VLFGLNVGYVPAEDHKGDLIGVEVVYDHKLDKLVRATFSEHGKTLIIFDLANAAAPESATITGKDQDGKSISEPACKINVSDHDYWSGGLSGGPGIFTGGDKHVFMTHDPQSGRCEHLAVYIEHGSHEPWPNQSGYYIGVASHNGDDVSFLPATVHVLGPADDPFVLFGGNYGDPVSGVVKALHLLGADALDGDADAGADAGRGQIGGRVDRSNVKRHVARELEESDIEHVRRGVGYEVATIVHGGGVRRQVDGGERRSRDDIRLKPDRLIIVDEKHNPLLNVRYRRRRAGGTGGMEIMNVDLRGIGPRAHGGTSCAGILNPTNKLHAVDERHGTLPCCF
jgi:hypothetical protein